jgi:hypothetical protein
MISIRVEKRRGKATVRFRVTAPSIERALELLRWFACAPAPRQRQTRREAGAQSLWASLREVARLPNGGGDITSPGEPHPYQRGSGAYEAQSCS